MTTVYTLQLENGKYYIGKTTNPQFRLDQHFNSSGSVWTTKYKPIKILELIPDCDEFDEEMYTLRYMNLYGIDNVRGGSFCTEIITALEVKIIEKSLNNANNKCFVCGKAGHFAKNCAQRGSSGASMLHCSNCGRDGHMINNCYAKTTVSGKPIVSGVMKCNIKCYHGKMLCWNLMDSLAVQGLFGMNQTMILEWVGNEYFRIKHPDHGGNGVYVDNMLSLTCLKKNAQLFKAVDCVKTGDMIEMFIQCCDKYLWVDETWYGYNLRNDSGNKGGWEKFCIMIV